MKYEIHPQIFDKIGVAFKNEGEYNHLYHKYKTDELKGNSLQKYNEFGQQVKILHKKMRLPLTLLTVTGLIFMTLIGGIMDGLPDVGLKQAYNKAPFLFWLLPILLVLTLSALLFFLYKRKRFLLQMAELNETTGKEVDKLIEEKLNIPSNTIDLCFFQRNYRARKAKPFSVFCQEFSAYADDLYVYIYWDAAVFKVPKRDCIIAKIVEAKIGYFDAMPTVNYKSPEIKQYKIKRNSNNNSMYVAKNFGRLLFMADGETWTMDVPPFAFETVRKLFGKEIT